MGQWEEDRWGRGKERERRERLRGKSKRIEEGNRHSNYRSRNEGAVSKNGEKENKEQNERRKRDTIRDSSLLSRWINYADQITEKRKLKHAKGGKYRKTHGEEEE